MKGLREEPELVQDSKIPVNENQKRISILSRRASSLSRTFALSSTSKSFQDERVSPTLVIAMILLDDPNPRVDNLRQVLADRLLDIPRFRCVVKDDKKGGIIFDPLARSDVDIDEHIAHIDGEKIYGEEDIEELINSAYMTSWDMDMPLWRIKIITNLKDGRSLLYVVIDHAIGDGVGLLSVFLSLFDEQVEETSGEGKAHTIMKKKRRKTKGLSLSHRFIALLNGIRVGIVHTLVPPPSDPPNSLVIPKDKLRVECPGKDFAQTRAFPLDEMDAMKKKFDGATLNDLIMALLAMAIKQYFKRRDGDTELLDRIRSNKATIRACFPVNMRQGTKVQGANLGNKFVFGNFTLPLDCNGPIDCVWRTKTQVDELKLSSAFALNNMIVDKLFPFVPASEIADKVLEAINSTTCMISNVKGPGGAASIAGYSLNDLNFTIAYPGNLYIGILSVGGKLRFSGILDRRTGGNLRELMTCVEESYDALNALVEDIDENEPLKRPDMTPRSAKVLELLFFGAVVTLPLLVAWGFRL